jgi:DNA-binding NarL/FixJ family response regulator
MEVIKLILAEDNTNYRAGLLDMLRNLPGVQVTGVASDGLELLQLVDLHPPQLVLTDINMPRLDGIEAMRVLKELHPGVKVIGLTMFGYESYLVNMLQAGARGYLYKDCTETELAMAFRKVSEGQYYHCPTTMKRISHMISKNRLVPTGQKAPVNWSGTEVQIIGLICEGYVGKEIADRLHLAEGTVKQYRHQIMKKMGVKTMVGVVKYAWQHGVYRG